MLPLMHYVCFTPLRWFGKSRRGRGGAPVVDRLSSCTNDAVSTTLRVVPALQIDCAEKKRAWNRPRGSIRSAPRCTRTVLRTFQPSGENASDATCLPSLVPCLFLPFSFFSLSFPERWTLDSVRKENTGFAATHGWTHGPLSNANFSSTPVFNRVSRTEVVRKHLVRPRRTRLNAKFPPLPV